MTHATNAPERFHQKDFDAELQIVCTGFSDPSCLDEIGFLRGFDFSEPALGRVYETLLVLHCSGEVPTEATVTHHLRGEHLLATLSLASGGAEYHGGELVQYLAEIEPTTGSVVEDARLVRSLSIVRQAQSVGRRLIADSQKRAIPDVNTWLNQFSAALANLAVEGAKEARGGAVRMSALADRLLAEINDEVDESPLETLFPDLDALIRDAMQPGKLTTTAARPAMGKTAFALDVARAVKKQDEKVLIFSLEVPEEDLTKREAAAETGVQPRYFKDESRYQKVLHQIQRLYSSDVQGDILIDDSRREFRQISAYSLAMRRRENIGFVIVDHLGLVKHSNQNMHFVQQVSEIVIGFKELAMRMGIPIMLLCQLNRDCEKRDDKRPMLSDLRSSGEIEQSSDVVIAIYRDVVYRPWTQSDLAEINVLKNRSGQIGRVYLQFEAEWTTFSPASPEYVKKELERIKKMTGKAKSDNPVSAIMAKRPR